MTLTSGADGDDEIAIAVADIITGYNLYTDAADVDVSLIIQGKAKSTTLANHIINNTHGLLLLGDEAESGRGQVQVFGL